MITEAFVNHNRIQIPENCNPMVSNLIEEHNELVTQFMQGSIVSAILAILVDKKIVTEEELDMAVANIMEIGGNKAYKDAIEAQTQQLLELMNDDEL